jgi:hypothetical protein
MSKINQRGTTTNNGLGYSGNGNLQHVKSPEQVLYEIAVSTLYGKEHNYYEPQDGIVKRLEAAVDTVVAKDNLDYVANVIIHARTNMNIRTMPLLLTGLFAKALREQGKTYPQLRKVVCDVIQRADQITDMISVARMLFGAEKAKSGAVSVQKMPMAFKRGIGDAFNKFDEYAFAKYNRNGAVKLRDVLRIVHPRSKDEAQGLLFEKIMKDELKTPYTWETRLSANGQADYKQLSNKDIWTELVMSGDVGYMALLRNLRNISQAGLDAQVEQKYVADVIASRENVLKSKQFPYAFLDAYSAIESDGSTRIRTAISNALDHSFANLPVIGDNVWIIIDRSTSMRHSHYLTDNQTPIKTACLFASALAKANANARNLKITMFSDNAKHIPMNTSDSIMVMTEYLMKNVYGGGTNLEAALVLKSSLGFEPDTIVVLSDMEVNQLQGGTVSKTFCVDAVKIAINLNSRDTTPIGEKAGWYQLAGWSEKLFDFIPAMRNGQSIVETLSKPYLGLGIKKLFS